MTNNRIPLALALATALFNSAPAASAAALGELGALSAIGAPFRAEIRLTGGERPAVAECFRVVAPSGSSADLPWLQAGQIRIVGSGANARLVVSSRTPMNEPVLKLAIENTCESRLRREYTLLLPYPDAAPVQATTAPRASTPRAAPAAPARSQARPPARATPPARTAAAPARARNQATANAASQDRLEVDKAATPGGARAGSAAAAAASASDALLARERELAAAIDRSIIAEMELLARIRELEEMQARLETRIRALDAEAAARATAPVVDRAPIAAPSTTAPAARPASTGASASDDRYLLGGLALAALLLTLLLLRRRTVNAPPSDRQRVTASTQPTTASALSTAGVLKSGAAVATQAAHANVTKSVVDWEPPSVAAVETPILVSGDAERAPNEEHKSAVELADIMMSFGRMHGAAETLAEFIRGNPKQAVTPWLKLLEVYRAAGLRSEFDAIARELNKTFNVNAVNWQNYDSLRASRTSLEDLPHIIETLQQCWRTTACQRYVQLLLRDNREGTRAGFPFTVIDEILLLSAILEEELGPYQPESGNYTTRR
ncbi:FimV family protein [Thauera sp. WH-1]|uniref:type IV pilus assembly protein FimV n=1 Tax=Thauera sp. WH-1 TaxID=3398230 RepID=UPI0039FDB39C